LETLGKRVEHRITSCLGNSIEQDHRGIKQRSYPMLGSGTGDGGRVLKRFRDF
jgi:transposase-like protein